MSNRKVAAVGQKGGIKLHMRGKKTVNENTGATKNRERGGPLT